MYIKSHLSSTTYIYESSSTISSQCIWISVEDDHFTNHIFYETKRNYIKRKRKSYWDILSVGTYSTDHDLKQGNGGTHSTSTHLLALSVYYRIVQKKFTRHDRLLWANYFQKGTLVKIAKIL